MPTFDTPCLSFKAKLTIRQKDVNYAALEMQDFAMLYITDLENKLAEQDEMIISLRDEIIRLTYDDLPAKVAVGNGDIRD